jgi:hypothetical protein
LIFIIAFIISSGIFAQGTDAVPTQEQMDQVLNDAMTTEQPAVQTKKPADKKIKSKTAKIKKSGIKKNAAKKIKPIKKTEKVTEGGKANE